MALDLKVSPAEVHDVHELAGHELVCELRKTSMVLYGMFVEVVREFYRDVSPYIVGCPPLKWDPDPSKTGLWIDSELNWNDDHPEFLPAVFVKLGDVRYASPAGPAPMASGMVLKDAVYRTLRTGGTTVSFVHVGGSAGEACVLCDNTRSYLSDFARPIASNFALSGFYEASATPMRQYQKDSKERWQSSSTFVVEWGEESGIKLESPILREIGTDFLNERGKYGILSSRRNMPDRHKGEYR